MASARTLSPAAGARLASGAFRPPHCPWPRCDARRQAPFRFDRHGSFTRRAAPHRIPRFRCRRCRRTFSSQTFSPTYYLKRPELLAPVAAGLVAGSAHRQLSRSLHCAPSTVTRLSPRLGRHCLLYMARARARLGSIKEPLVYDDFETFFGAQDFAVGLGTLVGQRSWFLYDLEQALHGRPGRRTEAQKQRWLSRLQHLHRPPPDAHARALARVLKRTLPAARRPRPLTLLSDDQAAYRRAVARHPRRERIRHRVYPNPPRGRKGAPRSAAAKRRDRALFPVDQLHGLIRHSQAHHRRETIAFGRRLNALLERAYLLMVWRNFVKRRSERRSRAPTPAMVLGLARRPRRWSQVLARRLFPHRVRVPAGWEKVYRRDLLSPSVGRNQRHRLVHAY